MVDAMTPKSRDATGTAWPHIVLLLAAAATGCSSTTMQSMNTVRDLGFNGYLNTLATNCQAARDRAVRRRIVAGDARIEQPELLVLPERDVAALLRNDVTR